MNKNVGLTYVKEFSFPAEQGFTGSAGVHKVRGYMRGGHVKKMAEGGKFGKPGDKYPALKSGPAGKRNTMPANVKSHGGSVHDRLKSEGAKMGYKYGGQVKQSNTSAEFVAKRGKQDTMDHGVQPAQKGRNQAEIEAGGNKRLKAGYMKGGGVHKVRASARRKASGAGMPKNVKAKGGLMEYAVGGAVKKVAAAP